MRFNCKGFTLIELLSILIIISIIGVITVPIVSNVVDNSRKNTARISALGYKDSVMRYYISGVTDGILLSTDLSGSYDVLNGVLSNESTGESHVIPLTGDAPSSGNVDLVKGDLDSGCLQMGRYAVVFSGGNVLNVEKNDCIHAISITASQVLYTPPAGVDSDVTNVQEAIDELYDMLN